MNINGVKIHNPLVIDVDETKPTFESNESKWWLVAVSKTKKYLGYLVFQKERKEKTYIVVDSKGNIPIYMTKQLEAMGEQIIILDTAHQNNWLTGENDEA